MAILADSIPKITLYGSWGSCSRVQHTLLNELDIPYKYVRIVPGPNGNEAADGSISHEEYVKSVHHSGYVPALDVDGTVITENAAIAIFITDLKPERQFWGATPLQKAKAMQWYIYITGTLHAKGFTPYWRTQYFTDDKNAYDSVQAKSLETIRKCFAMVDEQVGEQFAVDDSLTPVDFFLHTVYRWGRLIKLDMEKEYPRYTTLVKNLEKLESVREVSKLEEIEPYFKGETVVDAFHR